MGKIRTLLRVSGSSESSTGYGRFNNRMLVKAVGDPFGGNDCALAETIANKHPGSCSFEILSEK